MCGRQLTKGTKRRVPDRGTKSTGCRRRASRDPRQPGAQCYQTQRRVIDGPHVGRISAGGRLGLAGCTVAGVGGGGEAERAAGDRLRGAMARTWGAADRCALQQRAVLAGLGRLERRSAVVGRDCESQTRVVSRRARRSARCGPGPDSIRVVRRRDKMGGQKERRIRKQREAMVGRQCSEQSGRRTRGERANREEAEERGMVV